MQHATGHSGRFAKRGKRTLGSHPGASRHTVSGGGADHVFRPALGYYTHVRDDNLVPAFSSLRSFRARDVRTSYFLAPNGLIPVLHPSFPSGNGRYVAERASTRYTAPLANRSLAKSNCVAAARS
jgi:hypothetical protein